MAVVNRWCMRVCKPALPISLLFLVRGLDCDFNLSASIDPARIRQSQFEVQCPSTLKPVEFDVSETLAFDRVVAHLQVGVNLHHVSEQNQLVD